jgi:hypothetical protein
MREDNLTITLNVTRDDLDLLIKALEKLPMADSGLDLVADLFSTMLEKKESEMTPEELERKRLKKEQEKLKSLAKEQDREDLKRQAELLKARLLVAQSEAA